MSDATVLATTVAIPDSKETMKFQSLKICLLGEFAVGKTSTVARIVRNTFSEAYLTTVGVKVDSKAITLSSDHEVRLVLWDIAGSHTLDQVRSHYIIGAHALLLVADGTREHTIATAMDLREQAQRILGRELKSALLLNKADLISDWRVAPDRIRELRRLVPVFTTSARTGDGVEEALHVLAKAVVS